MGRWILKTSKDRLGGEKGREKKERKKKKKEPLCRQSRD